MSFADSVTISNGIVSGTAGAPSSQVVTVQGVTGGTPLPMLPALQSSGGASYVNAIAPSTPTVATVKSSGGNLYGVVAFNQSAAPVFIKFFDVAGTITLGTTPATFQFMVPGNTGGAGFVLPVSGQRSFVNSLRYVVTGAISATDNTGITAATVIVDVSYN